jgi:hypothetical protein
MANIGYNEAITVIIGACFLPKGTDVKQTAIAALVLLIFSRASGVSNWTRYSAENSGLAGNSVRAVCIDRDGVKWFGTENGLSRFDGSTWTTIAATGETQTLAHNRINDIAFEVTAYGPELWLATQNGVSVMGIEVDGVSMATPYRTTNTGLVSDTVRSVAVDSNHVKWFGTVRGVSTFTGRAWAGYATTLHLSDTDVLAIGSDNASGWKYVGTAGGGVSRMKIDTTQVDGMTSASPYDTDWSRLRSNAIRAVWVDATGDQWFGTGLGAAFHRGTETKEGWTVFPADSGLVNDDVLSILRLRNGAMWFGTAGGVSRFAGGLWRNYTSADGLAGDAVYDIAEDMDGSLWFATDGGVSHFSGPTGVDGRTPAAGTFALGRAWPNPFNPSVSADLSLDRACFVEADVLDTRGRRIRRLCSGTFTAGRHVLSWDGSDGNGGSAPSGAYILNVRAAAAEGGVRNESVKIVRLK